MTKRGRPKTVADDVHVKRYYYPSKVQDDAAVFKVMQERLLNAYNEVHLLAYDVELTWSQTNLLKKEISGILSQS
jgi:hypothetical protein